MIRGDPQRRVPAEPLRAPPRSVARAVNGAEIRSKTSAFAKPAARRVGRARGIRCAHARGIVDAIDGVSGAIREPSPPVAAQQRRRRRRVADRVARATVDSVVATQAA